MIKQFEIEKGIAIPPKQKNTKYPFQRMKVGDSFFVPYSKVKNKKIIQSTFYIFRKETKLKMEIDFAEYKTGIRVWRTK